MITNDQELAVTRERIQQFQDLLVRLRRCETAENYAAMATAYLLEIDTMNEEVHCYLVSPPRRKPKRSTKCSSIGSGVWMLTGP